MSDLALARIIGDSAAIRELRAAISRVAPLRLPVLIQGPTGSGKELVANALHALSGRRGRFVPLNVCALPESMFEAALFGHVRGAFTGALADSPGYLTEADRGTLFLDEISGLPLPLQAKLLRAVETGEFRPVGARADRSSDLRVLAASNERIEGLVAGGSFRADLAHRLSGVVLTVPALRERAEDIPTLVRHFASEDGQGNIAFTAGAVRLLQTQDWPGNVRELRHVIERAIAFSGGTTIQRGDMLAVIGHRSAAGFDATRGNYLSTERERLLDVLEAFAWDTASAAAQLDVHRATLYRWMQRLDIARPSSVLPLATREFLSLNGEP